MAISKELLAAYQNARDAGMPADDVTIHAFELGGMAVLKVIMDHAQKTAPLIDLMEEVNRHLGGLHGTIKQANHDAG